MSTKGATNKAEESELYKGLAKTVRPYKKEFKGKIVWCNRGYFSDRLRYTEAESNDSWKYFHLNFEKLGLKKLIGVFRMKNGTEYKAEYTGGDDGNIEAISNMSILYGECKVGSPEYNALIRESDYAFRF